MSHTLVSSRAKRVVLSVAKDLHLSVVLNVANGYPRQRVLHVLFMLLFACAMSAGAQPNQRATEQALFKLEDEFARAVVKRDAATMRRLTSPRWVYSDESGVMERDAAIKVFTAGTDTVKEASNERMRALVHGNTAVVLGILRLKGRGPKGPFDNRYRYTDTWMMIDGRWQIIAAQDYLMPEPKKK